MAKYETGIRTKEKILNACKKLFYEKGYDDTTYDDICREGHVNRGLIHYHFQGKFNIGRQVFSKFLVDNNELVSKLVRRKLPDTPVQYLAAVNMRSYLNLLQNDESLRRFYYQISRVTQFTTAHLDFGEAYHRRYFDAFGQHPSDMDLRFIAAAVMGMSSAVHIMFTNGYLDTNIEDYIDHRISLFYSLMYVDKPTIDKIIEESRKVYASLNIGVKRYFNVYAMR
jgi:AcrR family transcriptional regulator